jgi:integrase
MFQQHKIAANPIDRIARTKRIPAEDLEVVTVDSIDVPRLLEAARPSTERNAVSIAAYLGPRRHAIALLRDTDYDSERRTDPVPREGVEDDRQAGPGRARPGARRVDRARRDPAGAAQLSRPARGLPDPWRRPRRPRHLAGHPPGRRPAGVDAHVHALRAAFAVFYLERNPDDLLGLKELLGHRSLNTTLTYLRRLNKQVAMERVRTLSWAATGPAGGAAWLTATPPTALAATAGVGAGGFEPPSDDSSPVERAGGQRAVVDAHLQREKRRLQQQLEGRAREPEDAEATRETGR